MKNARDNIHQREKRKVHKFKKKAGWNDEHHLKPGGETIPSNLLKIDAYKHDALHLLFGNKSLDEIIALLQRLKKLKKHQKFYLLLN